MYAIIDTGGKQYRVELGTELAIDRLATEAGRTVSFERVLLVADGDSTMIGRPVVEGARVSADVVRQARGDKVVVFKYRPKARRRVKQGARADLTVLRISDIVVGGRSAAKLAAADRTERQRLEAAEAEVAAKQAEADQALATKLAKAAAKAEAEAKAKEAAEKPARGAKAAPKAPARKGAAKAGAAKAAPGTSARKTAPTRPAPTKPTTSKAAGRTPAARTQAPQPSREDAPTRARKSEGSPGPARRKPPTDKKEE